MNDAIPFELLDYSGRTVFNGEMPMFYVQPRIVKYRDDLYVLLSDVIAPGPETPHRYVLIYHGGIYEPSL
jgi:hypothetical protein